jgi:hypothetical protein
MPPPRPPSIKCPPLPRPPPSRPRTWGPTSCSREGLWGALGFLPCQPCVTYYILHSVSPWPVLDHLNTSCSLRHVPCQGLALKPRKGDATLFWSIRPGALFCAVPLVACSATCRRVWGVCRVHGGMSATATVASPTKREHLRYQRDRSHVNTHNAASPAAAVTCRP